MSAEEWQKYLDGVAALNARLLETLRRKEAEARADLDADRDDPELRRSHEVRLFLLEHQIADVEGTASYQQEAPHPVIVKADQSRKKNDSSNRNGLGRVAGHSNGDT